MAVDYVNLLAPAIVAAIISSLFMVGKKMNKTEQDILAGGIKLQQLDDRIKTDYVSADKLREEAKSTRNQVIEHINKLQDTVSLLQSKLEMLEYRIFRLEKNGNNNKK